MDGLRLECLEKLFLSNEKERNLTMDKSIIFRNIYKSFGETKALEDISFSVENQEIFGLIGPDGAGKTTLMRILATLYLPDRGEAVLEGFDVIEDYRQVRKEIGYMPGEFSLYQDLTVEENLQFFASVFNTTVEENYDLIKGLYSHIEPFKKRRAGALSGGMKQKLALSCALIHRPKVLILDEPNTGVDAVSRDELWKMLHFLVDEGLTVLVSTPYMDEAEKCDRIALMQEGEVMAIDTPDRIVDEFGQILYNIEASNIYKTLNILKEYKQTKDVYLFGQSIHFIPDNKGITLDSIKNYIKKKGIENCRIEREKPNIEDCFISLMKE